MASPTSAAEAAGALPMTSPVAGSAMSMVPAPPFARHCPSIKSPKFSYISVDPFSAERGYGGIDAISIVDFILRQRKFRVK